MIIRDRVRHFFYAQVHPHSFAILRIGAALFLMLYWYTEWRDALAFSVDGGIFLPVVRTAHPILLFFLTPSLPLVHAFFACTFVLLIFLLVGYRSRIAAAGLLLLSLYFYSWNQWMFATSYYRVFQFTLAVFLLPGADHAFSLRMLQKHASFFAWEPMEVLPLRFIGMQLTATYFGVSAQKLVLPGWTDGEILRRSFTSRWGTAFGFWITRVLPMWSLDWMMRITLVIELGMPFVLWMPRLQWIAFLGGFAFHTMVTLTLGIWWFQIMVPMYIVFLDPATVFQRLRVWTGNRIPMRPALAVS